MENRLAPATVGTQSFIQSDYKSLGSDGNYHGHYEALVLEGTTLNHYVNFQDDTGWHYQATVATDVSAPASLIQSDWVTDGHGHYEALVLQGSTLNHYVNSQDGTGWHFAATVATGVRDSASFIQSDYTTNGHGHYEALVLQGSTLNHYVNSQDGTGWHYAATVAEGVSGPAGLIQSDRNDYGHGYYEAVVPVGSELRHYYNSQDGTGWQLEEDVATAFVTGPASIIQSDWTTDDSPHGHLEVLVPQGNDLWHYYLTWGDLQWHVADMSVTSGISSPGSLIQSDWYSLGDDGSFHGHYEVIVQQGTSVNHYVNFQDGTGYSFWATVTGESGGFPSNPSNRSHPDEAMPLGLAFSGDRIAAVTQEEAYRVALSRLAPEDQGAARTSSAQTSDRLFDESFINDQALELIG